MIWAKIKCFFGFCAEKREIELREKIEMQRAVDVAYKKEPIVVEIKREEEKNLDPVNTIVVAKPKTEPKTKAKITEKIKKNVKAKNKPKVDKADKGAKVLKSAYEKMKVKRSWYNNGKTQKLVPVTEVESLPKVWKKGKLPKGDK